MESQGMIAGGSDQLHQMPPMGGQAEECQVSTEVDKMSDWCQFVPHIEVHRREFVSERQFPVLWQCVKVLADFTATLLWQR